MTSLSFRYKLSKRFYSSSGSYVCMCLFMRFGISEIWNVEKLQRISRGKSDLQYAFGREKSGRVVHFPHPSFPLKSKVQPYEKNDKLLPQNESKSCSKRRIMFRSVPHTWSGGRQVFFFCWLWCLNGEERVIKSNLDVCVIVERWSSVITTHTFFAMVYTL